MQTSVATTKRKCPECGKTIFIGAPIIFLDYKWHKRVDRLPVHKRCGMPQEILTLMNKATAEAASKGHDDTTLTLEGDIYMSLIDELKAEIARSKNWGNDFVTHKKLESLIEKYQVQTPGDISQQPGEWQVRGGYVDAIQHEGGEVGARKVLEWVRERFGVVTYLGSWDQEVDKTRLRLDTPRSPAIVNKGWWVIKTADDIFYTMPDEDFHVIYVPRSHAA